MASISFTKGALLGQSIELPATPTTLGRGHSCTLPINDVRISREHALLRIEEDAWWIHDLRSANGTFVNGQQIQAARLNDDDTVEIGDSAFVFHAPPADANAAKLRVTGSPSPAPVAESRAATRPPLDVPPPTRLRTRAAYERQASAELAGDDLALVEELKTSYAQMATQIGRVIVGQQDVVEQVLLAIFCRGHALLVGVPGLAKTLLVSTLGHVLDLSFKRIQFTPDLMPSDITGTDVLEEDPVTGKRTFRFVPGPVFANLLLADEINRTPPKTQAALLEAMQEHRVTVGDKTYHLPEPFFVLATQNPIEQEGTYPLPEAQLDRFMFNIRVDYPTEAEESEIIRQVTGAHTAELDVTLTGEAVLRLQQVVRRVPVADHVVEYGRDLARATRPKSEDAPDFVREMVAWGAGPRAGIYLVTAAKARAILHGRCHATTEDIRAVALPVLRHRILTTFNAEASGVTSDQIVEMLIEHLDPGQVVDV